MKKFGFLVFTAVLTAGLIFASGCSFGGLKNTGGVQGSGTAKAEQRSLRDFKKIEANGAVTIELTAQKDFAVEVSADDNLLQYIKTEVRGDTLEIYNESDTSPKKIISIRVSMPQIESLEVNGASTANVSNVRADSLDLKADGASKIKIDGQTRELDAEANGASKIDAENLKTEKAEIEANGASEATVTANGELKLRAKGASTIYYTGDPAKLDQDSSGASSIKKK